MVELVGDPCFPGAFALPPMTTAQANILSGAAILSGSPMISGAMIFNSTTQKAELWVSDHWESITSASRA